MEKTTAIILAAGKGTRMKNPPPKVLQQICGQPLIYYVLKQLSKIKTVGQIIIVVAYRKDLVKNQVNTICQGYFKSLTPKIQFVNQPKMQGTAEAVGVALGKIKFREVLVTCGDNPLIKSKTISSLLSFSRKKKLDCCILTSLLDRKNQLGAVVCDQAGRPKAIREKISAAGKRRKGPVEANSGTYYFDKNNLSKNLGKIKRNKKKKEYFLTDIIEILYKQNKRIGFYSAGDYSEVVGINNLSELQFAESEIKNRIIGQLFKKGVTVVNPQLTVIQEGAKIGKNSVIYPFTFIEKGVIIGSNCSVGPFAHIRPGSRIKQGVRLGNFLEVNRSHLGKGVAAKHFGYLGDAVVSDNVNIGAGTVVANYDGKKKYKTYIKKDAFIGCDTVLVAPVVIGKKTVTGAGSVVTKDVEGNQVVVGVPAHLLKKKK